MSQNNIEIQTSVAVKLTFINSTEEFGCTTACYNVSAILAGVEKMIGYLTIASKPVFGGGHSCFFAELCDEFGNIGNSDTLEADDLTEAAIAMLSFKLYD